LGEGGTGAVYKPYDSELGRTVAPKPVKPELATSPQITRRFKRELLLARKMARRRLARTPRN
jgi:serine/threonine protein kinase